MKFYKRDPDRALAGMVELTMKQRGVYNSIIDLLYSRDGKVPDDDRRVAKMIACHWREYETVKRELMALGKVWSEGGMLCAKRVQATLKEASDFGQEQARRASKGWQKRKNANENNDQDMPPGNALTPTPTPIDRKNPPNPPKGDGTEEADFEDWYSRYPRKVAKGSARRAFKKARKKIGQAELVEATEKFANAVGGKDREFIAHPATWLNAERWLDGKGEGEIDADLARKRRIDGAKDWLSRNDSIPEWMDKRDTADALLEEGYDYDELRKAGFSLEPRGRVVDIGEFTRQIAAGKRLCGAD